MALRPRSILLNGGLSLVALLIGLVLVEFGVRLLAPQPTGISHQDRYGLAMHWPGLVRSLPQFGTTASFNSAGMRDRAHPLEKPPGTYRILVLGDSFMEALQVEFEASLPSLLEQGLAAKTGKRVEVINAGVSGWGTDDELRYLTEYGVRYQPDLVLVAMTLHNDVSDNLREEWHSLVGDSLVARPHTPMSPMRYRVVQLKAFLATRFQTYQLWRKVRHGGEMRQSATQLNQHIVDLFREPMPEHIVRGFRLTDLLLGQIDSVARAHQGRTAVVLLPLRVQLTDEGFSDFVRSSGVSATEMLIERPQVRLTAAAHHLGVPVIDLLPAFRQWAGHGGGALYVETDGHWNKAGHRLATDVVVEGLMEAGVLR